MADPLEPNDLSHLTDYEFHTLCPLGEHAPGPEPLSPAAQAVLDAAFAVEDEWDTIPMITAALRAAADQVVPEFWHEEGDIYAETKHDVRADLLAIAAELEGANG